MIHVIAQYFQVSLPKQIWTQAKITNTQGPLEHDSEPVTVPGPGPSYRVGRSAEHSHTAAETGITEHSMRMSVQVDLSAPGRDSELCRDLGRLS